MLLAIAGPGGVGVPASSPAVADATSLPALLREALHIAPKQAPAVSGSSDVVGRDVK